MKNRNRQLAAISNRRKTAFPDVLKPLARLVEQGRHAEVERSARELQRILPGHPYVLKSLTFALIGLQRYDEALPLLEQALGVADKDAELHNNLGIVLSALLRSDRAIEAFDRALELAPGDAEVWKNKGAAYCHTSQWKEAVPCLLKAIELHPGDYDEAINLLAGTLLNADMNEEAFSCFTVLADADPASCFNLGALIILSLRTCRWGALDENILRLRQMTAQFERPALAPFHALSVPGVTELELRRIAACHAAATVAPDLGRGDGFPTVHRAADEGSDRRVRIGYLSYDFREHPVGHVIPQLVELHDRSGFEVFGYSMSADDGSQIRQRLSRAFDHFVDITALGIESGAERIAGDRIDVLIDLQGWTSGNRAAMLALRPAPTQVNWLGYAGTMADPRLADFVLGDPVVTPFAQAAAYSERILQLPNCYLPFDTTTGVPAAPGRAAAGLPEDGFVFCSMNNCYKFNPQVFNVWCSILKATPGSILWLSKPADGTAANLLAEASARGVSPERIVFARRVASRSDHLARLQLADLALDPWPYNSHSSGLDVLWAGVPMISLLGHSFAGRVGASLLTAAHLPECITRSMPEYLQLCVDLCHQPERLGHLKRRLLADRDSAPLFDTKRFVRALEEIYLSIHRGRLTAEAARRG
ncbi:tetratricopeptide repeat protein [Sulfuritalea sp.]|uniref:O-linked N-acetylglucosamine transferase, SPINDLY family protein n=1 Tax=Sulfuritalea sp. TaxID=2480090 RepID=UPI00286E177B|nr:tetratricopeptide repeat protein [Sulfuritalea sp.]